MSVADERSWTTIDKSDWSDGPWQREADKIQWVDGATDLDCLIVRGSSGALCGYVGVPPEHPYHGVGYEGTWDEDDNYTRNIDIDVHGGLTFSEFCHEGDDESRGVCHVPAPGRPEKVWWFGFDCAHAGDLMPGLMARSAASGLPWSSFGDETYKTVAYVRAEIARLAQQLAEAGQ